jgi:hypothetical protein
MSKTVKLFIVIIILALALSYFVWRDIKKTECPSTDQATTSCTSSWAPDSWKIWTDNYYSKENNNYFSYSIQYPRDFDVYPRDLASGSLIGDSIVKITFPQDAFQTPKTNFGEAYITISMVTGTEALANCYFLDSAQGQEEMTTTADINGIQFRTGHTVDVGAGNIYDSEVHRTIFDNRCFEAIETVHTGNIGNYPEGTVTEFDKSHATNILDQMLKTLKLSNNQQPL